VKPWFLAFLAVFGCTAPGQARLTPIERALQALHKGPANEAVRLLEPLAAASPNNLTLARHLAEAHVKAGSSESFASSLAGRSDAVAAYQLGLVRFASSAQASDPAIAAFERAVQLAPAEPEFRYRLGLALVESERYPAAIGHLESAVASQASKPGWWLPLAKAHLATQSSDKAVQAVRAAVEGGLSDSEVKVAKSLMNALSDPFANLPQQAKPAVEKALMWLDEADQPQQAIRELETTVRDYPDIAGIHALLGLAHARHDDAARAIDELKRAIELNPSDGKAHFYLAELYVSRQRGPQALELYRQAVDKNPTLTSAWARLGDLASERADEAEVLRCYRIASSLSPQDVGLRLKHAGALQASKDYPGAERELLTAYRTDETNVETALRLGLLFIDRLDRSVDDGPKRVALRNQAKRWLEQVLQSQPENAVASRGLELLNAQR
jgi:tetratricopeptide (TPR) repeat protein